MLKPLGKEFKVYLIEANQGSHNFCYEHMYFKPNIKAEIYSHQETFTEKLGRK
jgi:hypothetical protein